MNLKWAEDFLCLARVRSFSRAAAERHVTQSTLSRRICSLENWLGAPLIDRSLYPVALTEAGENFLPVAAEAIRQMYEVRSVIAQPRPKTANTVTFATQHSLSLNFFAEWIGGIEKREGALDVRLTADNYYGAAQSLREGSCDFLLCFTHSRIAAIPQLLFDSKTLGREYLLPVSAPATGKKGGALFRLPGGKAKPVPWLSYGPETFFGKVVRFILDRHPCELDLRCENAFAESLHSMALCGRGVAWLPECLIRDDVAAGRLVRVGGTKWRERLEIRLLRMHEASSPACEAVWRRAEWMSDNFQRARPVAKNA